MSPNYNALYRGHLPGPTRGDRAMKKKLEKKKLVLAKETVRRMEAADLRGAAGASVYVCPPPSWFNSCQIRCQDDDSEGTCTCP